jgi:protein-S-isoprenylcysteine O-methyltransferase Ste14
MKFSLALWAVWYAYWIVSAGRRVRDTAESTVQRESVAGRARYFVLLLAGFALIFVRRPIPHLEQRLWPGTGMWLAIGLTIQALGLVLAIWARSTLGKNWSGRISIGGNQELVIRGPYQMVRHPIYTGGLMAVLGTAMVSGQLRAFLGLMLVAIGISIKILREERALRQHFGEGYEEYAKRVPGLIPGWPAS